MQVIIPIFVAALYVFIGVMLYRFVRAAEKIADRMGKGIVIQKEDTTA
jgi:hypothetical protein